MNNLRKETYVHSQPWISLHDKRITRIECDNQSVVFHFDEGFDLVDNDAVVRLNHGRVKLIGCKLEEISCHIIKRRFTDKGEVLHGKPMSIKALNRLLMCEGKYVEVFGELYNYNLIHWRCELCSYSQKENMHISPYVIIETDFFPIEYSWDDSPLK